MTGMLIMTVALAFQNRITQGAPNFEAAFQGQCRYSEVPCQQLCNDHDTRTFECACREGYRLQHNGYSCVLDTDLNSIVSESEQMTSKRVALNHSQFLPNFYPVPLSSSPPSNRSPCGGVLCLAGGICSADRVHGYRCLCPLGRKGKHCDEHVVVSKPRFNGDAYAMLPLVSDWSPDFGIVLDIQADTENGVVFFSGQDLLLSRDYIVLELVEGYINFHITLAETMVTLQSRYKIPLGDLVRVRAGRRNAEVYIQVASENKLVTISQDLINRETKATENIYLGGLPDYDNIQSAQLVSQAGFVGCILFLSVNGKNLTLEPLPFGAIIQGINLDRCSADSCQGVTCLNSGECISDSTDSAKCDCPVPFAGAHCEIDLQTHVPFFNGTSYLVYDIPVQSLKHTLHFHLAFKPSAVDSGVLLHIGGESVTEISDTIQLQMGDGHLEIALDMGEGYMITRSQSVLHVDTWYHVSVRRSGRLVEMFLQDEERVETIYNGAFSELNIGNNLLYVGGLDYNAVRSSKNSFRGCIDLNKSKFMRTKLNLSKATAAVNLKACRP